MSDRVEVETMTVRRRCRITLDRGLQIFSSFVVPLLLTIFTIVIAVYQQQIANDNRQMDIKMNEDLRLQDQRAAEKQRAIDRNESAQQRRDDREDGIQKRKKDKDLADIERQKDVNSSDFQRERERTLDNQLERIAERERSESLVVTENRKQEEILRECLADVLV